MCWIYLGLSDSIDKIGLRRLNWVERTIPMVFWPLRKRIRPYLLSAAKNGKIYVAHVFLSIWDYSNGQGKLVQTPMIYASLIKGTPSSAVTCVSWEP